MKERFDSLNPLHWWPMVWGYKAKLPDEDRITIRPLDADRIMQQHGGKCNVHIIDYETINKTTAKIWEIDSLINLERSLLPTTRMGGHFVQGHVDNVISIKSIKKMDDSAVWQFYLPQNLKRYIVQKGSICLDGISLTVADKKEDYFSVALIPHTLKKTTWSEKKIDDLINIEVDIMAKYIESIIRD